MRLLFGLFLALAGCCAIVACSGSVGGGTSALPGGQLPALPNPATPAPVVTASPSITLGDIVVTGDGSEQTLAAPGDFKVTAVFPKSTASPVTLHFTVSVNGPGDIAPYGDKGVDKKKMFVRHHTQSPAVIYVWFESDKGVTIASPPTLSFSVPLSALEPYGTDPVVDLGLFDPAGENRWMQRVATSVDVTPAPAGSGSGAPSATPTATATVTPTPSATPTRPGATPSPSAPGMPISTPRPPVPMTAYRFSPTQRTMKLLPRKNFVFVLYAVPAPTETPSAGASAQGKARAVQPSPSGSAGASSSPSAASSASASPEASSSGAASPSGAPSPAPAKS